MNNHSREEFEENEQMMMDLFRQLSWRNQVELIGYTIASIDRAREKELKKIVRFPGSRQVTHSGENMI